MSSEAKRYYWLKLKDNFFEREEIQLIESLPNGKEYILILLKFMMKAINTQGRLVIKEVIPYNPQMLATITHSNIDTVRNAIEIFIKFGLMNTLDDGTLYMNKVQVLLGSETEYAAKKRSYRDNLKNQPRQLPDKSKTKKDNVSDNVRQENNSLEKENRDISPYSPSTPDLGNTLPDFGVSSICVKNNYRFSEPELQSILLWLNYKMHKFVKPVLPIEIEQTLLQLAGHKAKSYDIVGMINRSIANGYTGVMSPTKEFSLSSKNALSEKSQSRYPAPEYIIPENREQRRQLCSYIDSCYRQKLNPKTGKPMTSDELKLITAHHKISEQSSPPISWNDYIYQNEVLKGIYLLDQAIG